MKSIFLSYVSTLVHYPLQLSTHSTFRCMSHVECAEITTSVHQAGNMDDVLLACVAAAYLIIMKSRKKFLTKPASSMGEKP